MCPGRRSCTSPLSRAPSPERGTAYTAHRAPWRAGSRPSSHGLGPCRTSHCAWRLRPSPFSLYQDVHVCVSEARAARDHNDSCSAFVKLLVLRALCAQKRSLQEGSVRQVHQACLLVDSQCRKNLALLGVSVYAIACLTTQVFAGIADLVGLSKVIAQTLELCGAHRPFTCLLSMGSVDAPSQLGSPKRLQPVKRPGPWSGCLA